MQAGWGGGRPLRLVAVNVNGLVSDAAKRRGFFAWLRQQGFDIAVLSETHATSDAQARQWLQQGEGPGFPWKGEAWWCHSGGAQPAAVRGVGILVRDGVLPAGAQPAVEFSDSHGRLLRVGWRTRHGQRAFRSCC